MAISPLETADVLVKEAAEDDQLSPPELPSPSRSRRRSTWYRLVRGRPQDPPWVRPALFALLAVTAFLYLWDLGASGWANSFYSAAVQAGTKSWKAFFFGSSDASNFITVDKPPASLWVMEISARLFGLNAWSILVPQALEGVATVGVLYVTVRRWFSPAAALFAGAVVALTPVAALMFRYNNPDALLVLLLTGAAYATVRALERGRTWWLVLAGTLVGFGFITKMLQAFLVVPALVLVYLLAAPTPLRRRVLQVLGAGAAMVAAAGWWVAAVMLTPAADRPYIGGSQDNSLFNLIFGYNGFGRITGNETGSVGGGGTAGSMWGPTGWDRLFLSSMGGQISWLIPAALIGLVAVLWLTRRAPRTNRARAAALLFGGYLLVTGAVLSFSKGIIHPYYTVALAPAIGALVGIGAVGLWRKRSTWFARAALAAATVATVVWAFVLLDRSPAWLPGLRWAILVVGSLAAAAFLLPVFLQRRRALVIMAVAGAAALAGPLAYTIDTVTTPHNGAIPSAGPTLVGSFGPGGGGFGGSPGAFGGFGPGARTGAGTGGFANGAPPFAGGQQAGGSFAGGFPGGSRFTGGRGGAAGGVAGGLLNSSTPGAELVKLLESDASRYSWVAATVGSNSASGYQLATDDPVMAIGGFNGTDPAPSLAEFEKYVAEGKIHYFIAGGGGFGGGGGVPGGFAGGVGRAGAGTGQGGQSDDAAQITTWVEDHFTVKTVDGVSVYDLTEGMSKS